MKFLKTLFEKTSKVQKIDVNKRFDLISRVGQGSMSKVWKARDSKSGKTVALKILDKEKTRRLESRFVGLNKPTEGEIAVQLHHPHIVRTYEHGVTKNDEQFLVMEFVEGLGLSFLVEAQNDVMKENRLQFIIQLGEAVDYFHQSNWIHRDICPRNVLVDQDHQIKLIDFGLVVPNTPEFQKPGNRTGTASYMAPELIKRQRTDQRIDVFSYAVTCFEIYTGRLPWEAAETLEAVIQHINKPPADIQQLVPEIDKYVAETIMRGLLTDPGERWSSIRDMLGKFRETSNRQKKSSSSG